MADAVEEAACIRYHKLETVIEDKLPLNSRAVLEIVNGRDNVRVLTEEN